MTIGPSERERRLRELANDNNGIRIRGDQLDEQIMRETTNIRDALTDDFVRYEAMSKEFKHKGDDLTAKQYQIIAEAIHNALTKFE